MDVKELVGKLVLETVLLERVELQAVLHMVAILYVEDLVVINV